MRHQGSTMKDEPNVKIGKIVNVSEEQEIQIFAKQMLSKRLFVGHYQERRYVETLNSYRDIVKVSEGENDLTKDLLVVKKRILPFHPPHSVWTGITGPDLAGAPVGVCLWVQLTNVPFGHYWFQIREVQFLGKEVILRIKCIRSYTPEGESLASKILHLAKDIPTDNSTNSNENNLEIPPNFGVNNVINIAKNIKYDELGASIWSSLTDILTIQNVKNASKFSILLLVSTVAAIFNLIMYVGDFSLKLIHEISYFIHACTPIFLGIIDFFSKCVGGFYILIAMIWRGAPPNFPTQQNRPKPLALQNYPHSGAPNFRQQSQPHYRYQSR